MSALAAVNVVAIVSSLAIGSIPFLEKAFAPPADEITTVRIQLGFSNNTAASLGGNAPGVALWDDLGEVIVHAFGESTNLPQGTFFDQKIVANKTIGNVDATYMSITNGGDDAVCIQSIAVTFPNNDKAGFTGDPPKLCGADWFHSSLPLNDDPSVPIPACVWVDRDGSNGLRFQGFGVHIPDFKGTAGMNAQYNASIDTMCKSGPRFRMYESLHTEDPILVFKPTLTYTDNGTDSDTSIIVNNPGVLANVDPKAVADACVSGRNNDPLCTQPARRSPNPAPAGKRDTDVFMEGHLVLSSYTWHSARELCESSTSKGPDFVSITEGLHCDMTTRQVSAVCSNSTISNCFDMKVKQMSYGGMRIRGDSLARSDVTPKTYHATHQWGF